MRNLNPQVLFSLAVVAIILIAASGVAAQSVTFEYLYQFEPTVATKGPELSGLDIAYPESARKNGAEGTVKASMTLGEDGKVRDIQILEDLPFGIGDAVRKGLEKWYFKPAMLESKPVAMRLKLDYVVTLVYGEGDGAVTKPRILTKPLTAEYPAKYLAEKVKGTVSVRVMFFANGKLKVSGVSSTMPKEFDKAANAAAEKLQFQPAIHKKSKKPVSQELTIEFSFKP